MKKEKLSRIRELDLYNRVLGIKKERTLEQVVESLLYESERLKRNVEKLSKELRKE